MIELNDPKMWELFGAPVSDANVHVGEYSALGLTAVHRAVSIIASTVAALPLHTQRDVNGTRTRVSSFLDDPGGPNGPTRYEWTETLMLHLLLHGNAFLLHIRNGAGSLVALDLIHPACVQVEWEFDSQRRKTGRKLFRVSIDDGTRTVDLTEDDMTHIPAMTLDGLRGVSPISVARNAFGTAIAGDRAAAKMFSQGALFSGIVSLEDDESSEVDAANLSTGMGESLGWQSSGSIVVAERKMKFTPWSMSMEDAQFIQSRQFQIEEIARIFGVPPHLLMQTEKQTSWGTGVAEQNRGLARFTLQGWTSRIEQRLSRLLPAPRFVEFDYAGLLKPAPEQEIPLLIQQVQAGLMTVNEARRIRGMDPIAGGDTLASPQQQQLEAVPA